MHAKESADRDLAAIVAFRFVLNLDESAMDRRILVVDDSELICRQVSGLLTGSDRVIKIARDGTTALEWLVEGNFSLVLTDLLLPGISGLDLIRELRERSLPVTAVLMTGHASVTSAVEAMRLGAYDYLQKPIDPVRLRLLVEQALADRRLEDEVRDLRQSMQRRFGFHNLLGRGPEDARGLREGGAGGVVAMPDSGVGRDGHGQGTGGSGDALCERDPERSAGGGELRGVAGVPAGKRAVRPRAQARSPAPTGRRRGGSSWPQGGTLFLDEIGEMPLGMQAKLLRVAAGRAFRASWRHGESDPADCRVVAATNVDLASAVADGRFREDLFYRLNVVSIDLPPLRDAVPRTFRCW